MTLKDPQKLLDNLHVYLEIETKKVIEAICKSGFYYIKRDEESTVEKTLLLLEKHFGLT